MKIVKQSAVFERPVDGDEVLQFLERCGRTAYKSEDKITPDSASKFIAGIMKRGHLSVIEHASFSVRFICDRGVSHEIVRHRIASYTQESTRYCNYAKAKPGHTVDSAPINGEVTFIEPLGMTPAQSHIWTRNAACAEYDYFEMLKAGAAPQIARSVLTNGLKTELVMTANAREWRHFFKMRTDKAAHPQMQEVANIALKMFQATIPVLFDDIVFDTAHV